MKIECSICKISKPVECFHKNKRVARGYQFWCIDCRKEWLKKRRAEMTPEEIDKMRARDQRLSAATYKKRKDGLLPPMKRLTREEKHASIGWRASNILYTAKKRQREQFEPFSIDRAWIMEKLKRGKCEKSGLDFDFTAPDGSRRNPFSPSLDRIDNSKGYTKENCQIVCTIYNLAKSDYDENLFIQFCKDVAHFNADTTGSTH